jgi:hypothetical protein
MADRLDANRILAALAAHADEAFSVGEIAQALKQQHARKRVINRLGCLMKHRLVERAPDAENRERKFGESGDVAFYRATKEGRAFVKAGKRVKCGRQGPLTGAAAPREDTYRARLWKVLRTARKATVPELVEAAATDTATKAALTRATNQAQIYVKALVRAGVAAVLPVKAKGYAPTSNGFKRFALVRDLGPLAPSTRASGLFDPNTRETIPYAPKEMKR